MEIGGSDIKEYMHLSLRARFFYYLIIWKVFCFLLQCYYVKSSECCCSDYMKLSTILTASTAFTSVKTLCFTSDMSCLYFLYYKKQKTTVFLFRKIITFCTSDTFSCFFVASQNRLHCVLAYFALP